MFRNLTILIVLLIGQAVQTSAVHSAELPITIEVAWVREGPPVAKVLAGYMTVNNRSGTRLSLRSARSENFDRVEFHRSMIVDGVARMKRQTRIEIPAGGQVIFEPGGQHLMLIDPVKALKSGDTVELTLVLEDGREINIAVAVRSGPPQ